MVNGKPRDLEWTERGGFVLGRKGEKLLHVSLLYILFVFI